MATKCVRANRANSTSAPTDICPPYGLATVYVSYFVSLLKILAFAALRRGGHHRATEYYINAHEGRDTRLDKNNGAYRYTQNSITV
jgi:hypothetical protein